MNWDAIGAIGEIVGAIAVIVTIGYLALQMRRNTRSVRSAAAQQILEGLAEFNQFLSRLLKNDLEVRKSPRNIGSLSGFRGSARKIQCSMQH